MSVQTIAFGHHVSNADELWNGMLTGTVRTSALFWAQSEQIRRHARAAFERLVLQYQSGERLELPVSVKLAHGRKDA